MRHRTTRATAFTTTTVTMWWRGLVIAVLVAVLVSTASRGGHAQNDIVDHFKYGAVGTEARVGLPYPVFRALPLLCADKLPPRPGRGYEKLGFLYESPAAGRPIGTTYSDDKTPLVGLNCATCHAGSYREAPGAPRRIVLGMPAHQMDLQGYARFLTACAQDPKFTASALVEAIRRDNPDFGWFESLLYRWVVFDRVKKGILERAQENSWFDSRPPQGPGRVDTFNPYKKMLGLDLVNDTVVGTVDLPSLWQQRIRQGLWLHWDGNNNSVEERNKSAAIGAGATPESLNLAALGRIEQWILDLQPPSYPAARVDAVRASAGRTVYDAACASCHAPGGARLGQVTPLAEIGTDPERLHSFTAELAAKMNTIGEGRPWKFSHFRKTEGYANMPLDGLWLRAPYLHNGSVPTLRALLFPEDRPVEFYRAYDVIDWADVGFVWRGADAERQGVKFDTRVRGNGNGGHVYGQELPREQREQLLEYLKTL
jgi:mono/diheme cytochrome c family protein